MSRRLGGLAAAVALLAVAIALLAVGGAAGDATRDPREGGPRYDLAKAKIAQHKHDLVVHLRTWGAFPKLQALERHPRTTRAPGKRFVCMAVESSAADRLLCPAGKPEKGHVLVGVSRLSKGGRAHSIGLIRAGLDRSDRGVALRFRFARVGLEPGHIHWYAVSGATDPLCTKLPGPSIPGTGGLKPGCFDRAPNTGRIRDKINEIVRVGCTAPNDLAFSNGPRSHKAVALTFDDGPSTYTDDVLHILEDKHVKGTFFDIGENVGGGEKVMRRIVASGNELGNHSMHHSPGPSKADMKATNDVIEHATGFKPCLFRPPGGYLPGSTAQGAHELGMTSVLWDVDTRDWETPGSGTIYARAVQGGKGSIVLMHDGGGDRSQTVDALPGIIDHYKHNGYRLVTVTQLIGGHFITREKR